MTDIFYDDSDYETAPLFFHLESLTPEERIAEIENLQEVNLFNEKGRSLLHFVAWTGDPGAVSLLIKKGANVNATDMDGRTPLHHASDSNRMEDVKILLEHGANINAVDAEGKTPLFYARQKNFDTLVEFLSSCGAVEDCSLVKEMENFDYTFALSEGFEKLPEETPPPHQPRTMKNLHDLFRDAILNNDVDFVSALIDHSADLNCKNPSGLTPLHTSAGMGNLLITRLLIEGEAEIDIKDFHNKTPLYFACERCYTEVAKLLLEKGADVHVKDNNGWTILSTVASLDLEDLSFAYGRQVSMEEIKDLISLLIKHGACVNATNDDGSTAIDCVSDDQIKEFLTEKMLENAKNEIALLLKDRSRLATSLKRSLAQDEPLNQIPPDEDSDPFPENIDYEVFNPDDMPF